MRLNFFYLTLYLSCFFWFSANAKVRILTCHYNNPQCIIWQQLTYSKFLENDYELIVFNDAKDPKLKAEIKNTCDKCGFKCVRFKQKWHLSSRLNQEYIKISQDSSRIYSWLGDLLPEDFDKQPSLRHTHVLQYAMDNFGYGHDDIVVIADADIFPIRPFNLKDWMRRYDILGLKRVRPYKTKFIEYLWPVFIAFKPKNLPHLEDFRLSVDLINGAVEDTGSHTYHYLQNNPQVRVYMSAGYQNTPFYKQPIKKVKKYGFNDQEIELINSLPPDYQIEFHLSQHFLHFAGISFHYEGHNIKLKCLKNFINRAVKSAPFRSEI